MSQNSSNPTSSQNPAHGPSPTPTQTSTQRKLTDTNGGFAKRSNMRSAADPTQKPLDEMTNDVNHHIRNLSQANKYLKDKGILPPQGHQAYGLTEIITSLFQLSYFPTNDAKTITNAIRSIGFYLISIEGALKQTEPTHTEPTANSTLPIPPDTLLKQLEQATSAVKESAEIAAKVLSDARKISERLDSQNTQLSEMASNIAEDIERKLGQVAEGLIDRIDTAATSAQENVQTASKAIHDAATELSTAKKSYSQVLQSKPTSTYTPTQYPFASNPLDEPDYMKEIRDKAKRSILNRQILIDPRNRNDTSKKFMADQSLEAIKEKANAILREMTDVDDSNIGEQTICFVGVKRLANGGILLETNDEEAAETLRDRDVQKDFLNRLDPDDTVIVKNREYQVIAFGIPTSFDVTSVNAWRETEEVNSQLGHETITRGRWVKPPHRRTPGQNKANAIFYFNSAESANSAILKGLLVCQRLINCERVKKEPLRCMKCQLYDHLAHECLMKDVCSTCGKEHKSQDCDNRMAKFCVACNTDDHCSWDRTKDGHESRKPASTYG